MTTHKFEHLLSSEGWITPGFVCVTDAGLIKKISDTKPYCDVVELGGIALPGLSNLHSHAFQRALSGLTEKRTSANSDSFWTWRDLMYRFVAEISPDDLQAIASQLYVEMLKAGYTSVAEFHYLHHDTGGAAYADTTEMASRIIYSAVDTGINLSLLPVLYQYSNFGNLPPVGGQNRFINDSSSFIALFEKLKTRAENNGNFNLGVALHSLRAIDPKDAQEVLDVVGGGRPIHVHVAEQIKEVTDCLEWSGQRPVEFLLNNFNVNDDWCLIHATHMTNEEVVNAARSGAIAGLCPVTEANLGDGVFNLPAWLEAGGRFGIGSDSHISVDTVEELRWLEYGQRLIRQQRNVAASDDISTGNRLLAHASVGGARAVGNKSGVIEENAPADIIVLDSSAAVFAGQTCNTFVDSWVFSGNVPVVSDVFAAGRHVVQNGTHINERTILDRYKQTMKRLIAIT
jgi:formimidoylglutamate deiminase